MEPIDPLLRIEVGSMRLVMQEIERMGGQIRGPAGWEPAQSASAFYGVPVFEDHRLPRNKVRLCSLSGSQIYTLPSFDVYGDPACAPSGDSDDRAM